MGSMTKQLFFIGSILFLFQKFIVVISERISLAEGQNYTLHCPLYDCRWLVTVYGELRPVSLCQTDYRNCTNYESANYIATFVKPVYYTPFFSQSSNLTYFQILNVERGLTKVECKACSWIFTVNATERALNLTSNLGTGLIYVTSGSKVNITCASNDLVPLPLQLYVNGTGSVLNVSNTAGILNATVATQVTYRLANFTCGTRFIVGCRVLGETGSDQKMIVSVAKCKTTTLLANNESGSTRIKVGQSVIFQCWTSGGFGHLIVMYRVHPYRALARTYSPSVLTYIMSNTSAQVTSFVVGCSAHEKVNVTVVVVPSCQIHLLDFTANSGSNFWLEVDKDSPVTFVCKAFADCDENITLISSNDGQVLVSIISTEAIVYTLSALSCGDTLDLSCRLSYLEKRIVVTVAKCSSTTTEASIAMSYHTQSTISIIVGVSIGSACAVLLLFGIGIILYKRNQQVRSASSLRQQNPQRQVDTSLQLQQHHPTDPGLDPHATVEPPAYSEIFSSSHVLVDSQGLPPNYIVAPPAYDAHPPSYDDVIKNCAVNSEGVMQYTAER